VTVISQYCEDIAEMRLKRWRQEAGLDGRELALALGVSPSWVSKLERGRGKPKPSLARRIARVLGVPYAELWRAVNEDYLGSDSGHGEESGDNQ
jgi:transcriptional regulator with XRE-family HTH domain